MRKLRVRLARAFAFATLAALSGFATRSEAAPKPPPGFDDSPTIRQPGRHPKYRLEIEPHLDFTPFVDGGGSAGGVGARVTIPLLDEGFIAGLDDGVGIGFGGDFLRYSGCYRVRDFSGSCSGVWTLRVPVVMQWNFWLSPHWSAFGEPGVVVTHVGHGAECDLGTCPSRDSLDLVVWAGGRWHFGEKTALTLRLGAPLPELAPYASLGVSFF